MDVTRNYGCAGPAFIRWLIAQGWHCRERDPRKAMLAPRTGGGAADASSDACVLLGRDAGALSDACVLLAVPASSLAEVQARSISAVMPDQCEVGPVDVFGSPSSRRQAVRSAPHLCGCPCGPRSSEREPRTRWRAHSPPRCLGLHRFARKLARAEALVVSLPRDQGTRSNPDLAHALDRMLFAPCSEHGQSHAQSRGICAYPESVMLDKPRGRFYPAAGGFPVPACSSPIPASSTRGRGFGASHVLVG